MRLDWIYIKEGGVEHCRIIWWGNIPRKKKKSCNDDDDDDEEILFPFMIAHTGEMEWKRLLAASASESADPIKSSRVRGLLHLVLLHPIRNGLWIVNQRASQGPGRGLEQIKAFVGITWYGPSRLESTERREKRSSSWNDDHYLTSSHCIGIGMGHCRGQKEVPTHFDPSSLECHHQQ